MGDSAHAFFDVEDLADAIKIYEAESTPCLAGDGLSMDLSADTKLSPAPMCHASDADAHTGAAQCSAPPATSTETTAADRANNGNPTTGQPPATDSAPMDIDSADHEAEQRLPPSNPIAEAPSNHDVSPDSSVNDYRARRLSWHISALKTELFEAIEAAEKAELSLVEAQLQGRTGRELYRVETAAKLAKAHVETIKSKIETEQKYQRMLGAGQGMELT